MPNERDLPEPDADGDFSELLRCGLDAGFGPASEPATADSVIESLAQATGIRPGIALPGAAAPAPTEQGAALGKYRIHGELARGGVGVVFRGHDSDLGRDVAFKMLQTRHRSDFGLLQRFVEEAQIGGQLQHPGIVPVYDMGMQDGRPFFTMKLIDGRTLAEVLRARRDVADERARCIGIFEQVCQTMAYAHDRGVIHRDLKPGNVMVGAFGEVQVVDWGMGKVLPTADGGGADETVFLRPDGSTPAQDVETVRTKAGPDSTGSLIGSVMGTPGYMPPEQARGDVDRMDERSDVFALGAILAEILTGQPAYSGSRTELVQRAARADLADCHARLAASDADAALREIATRCLQADPDARPPNAKDVATQVRAYLTSVEDRAREAQIAAAEERVRSTAARRSQRLAVALALVTASAAVALVFGIVSVNDERERTAEQARRAEANFAMAAEAVDAMLRRLPDRLVNTPHMQEVRRDLLREALGFHQKFLELRRDDPTALEEVAETFYRTASIHRDLGEINRAVPAARASLERFATLRAGGPLRLELVRVENHARGLLSMCLTTQGDTQEATALETEFRRIAEKLANENPDNPDDLASYAAILNAQAKRQFEAGEHDAGIALLRESIAIQKRAVPLQPELSLRYQLGTFHKNLGLALHRLGRRDPAEAALRESLKIFEALVAQKPNTREYRHVVAKTADMLATVLRVAKPEEAARYHKLSVEMHEALVDRFPEFPRYHAGLGAAYHNLAGLHFAKKDYSAALESIQKALPATMRARQAQPKDVNWLRFEVNQRNRLLTTWMLLGQFQPALAEADILAKIEGAMPAFFAGTAYAGAAWQATDAAAKNAHKQRALELLEKAVAAGFRDARRLRHSWLQALADEPRYATIQKRIREAAQRR